MTLIILLLMPLLPKHVYAWSSTPVHHPGRFWCSLCLTQRTFFLGKPSTHGIFRHWHRCRPINRGAAPGPRERIRGQGFRTRGSDGEQKECLTCCCLTAQEAPGHSKGWVPGCHWCHDGPISKFKIFYSSWIALGAEFFCFVHILKGNFIKITVFTCILFFCI